MRPEQPVPAQHVILMCQPGVSPEDAMRGSRLDAAARSAVQAAARAMYESGHHPGPLLASATPAGRETAALIAEAVHVDPADIHFSNELHGATTDQLEVEIRALALEFTLVTLVAFNPGVSELVRILSRDHRAPELQPGQWRYLPWPPPY